MDDLHIPERHGFHDLDGFIDYFAHVVTLDRDDLEPEWFVPAELQWTLHEVFLGLELGYQLIGRDRGNIPLLAKCRRLTADAHRLYGDGRYDEGHDKLSAAQALVESLAPRRDEGRGSPGA